MNANEVIATLAGEDVHPNDDVNMGQSSNDVFPSAVHLAALGELVDDLLPALDRLARLARGEGGRVRRRDQVRPHALDGRRPGHARPGVRRLRGAGARRAARGSRSTLERLGQIPLGGTAVGTGLNTHPEFAARVRARLADETGLAIQPPADPFESQAARDGLVEASGALKVVAVSLTKIANDLRYLGSGPRAGLAEIFLPELQKGSSIMPGKVNPVIPEVVTQVAAQVIGNDAAITVGGMQGHFELNVFIPLMARNLLDSIRLLAAACRAPGREVRRRDRGEPRAVRALRRADALGRDRAEPVHRLRQGERDREEGRRDRPLAARGRARGGRRGSGARRGARLPRDGQAARRSPRPSVPTRAVARPRREGFVRRRRTFCRQAARRRRREVRGRRDTRELDPVEALGARGDRRCGRLGPRRRGRRLGVEPHRSRSRHAAARRGRAGRHLRRSRRPARDAALPLGHARPDRLLLAVVPPPGLRLPGWARRADGRRADDPRRRGLRQPDDRRRRGPVRRRLRDPRAAVAHRRPRGRDRRRRLR